MSKLTDFLSDRTVPIFSLDIETTSTSPYKGNPWSVGFVGLDEKGNKIRKEFFLDGVLDQKYDTARDVSVINEGLADAHRAGGIGENFISKQKNRDPNNPLSKSNFDFYSEAKVNGNLKSMTQVVDELSSDLKDKFNILIIQNDNFEKSFFDASLQKRGNDPKGINPQGISEAQASTFVSDVFKETYPNEVLVKENSQAIQLANSRLRAATMAHREASVNNLLTASHTLEIQQAVQGLEDAVATGMEKAQSKSSTAVVDLMDITKVYQGVLAEHGILDYGLVGAATNVNLLTQIFLNKDELHGAAEDASDQLELTYKKLNERIISIRNTGKLSPEDKALVSKLQEGDLYDKNFISGLKSKIEEHEKGIGRNKSLTLEELVHSSSLYYENLPSGGFDRQGYTQSLMDIIKNNGTHQNLIKELEGAENLVSEGKVPKVSPVENTLNPQGKALSSKSKILMGVGATVGVMWLGSMDGSNTKPKKQEMTSYDDLYGNVYLGQSYADWQERNNSHRMIY